jgi:hypothetical protein
MCYRNTKMGKNYIIFFTLSSTFWKVDSFFLNWIISSISRCQFLSSGLWSCVVLQGITNVSEEYGISPPSWVWDVKTKIMFHQNVGNHLQNHMTSQARKPQFSWHLHHCQKLKSHTSISRVILLSSCWTSPIFLSVDRKYLNFDTFFFPTL